MPTFQELKARYMDVGSSTSLGSNPPSIPISTNNKVTPLIHGRQYFPALKAEIDRLGSGDTSGQFIYLMGWWLDIPFSLNKTTNKLSDLLKAKARAGVDVRVMTWVMAPEILQDSRVQNSGDPNVGSMLALNNESVEFIKALRAESNLANQAVLNILAHPAGAVHMKFALVGDRTKTVGFTGGIDLQTFRHEDQWHDVAAKVEGPVVQSMFAAFREQWNEIKGRSPVRLTIRGFRIDRVARRINRKTPITANSHSSSMPTLANRSLTLPNAGQSHVQSLTTVPRMNFSIPHSAMSLPTNDSLSYAPRGRFDVRNAWIRALQGAQTYIYMEDQAFTGEELFDVMNAQIKAQSGLKVILTIGGPDPTAPGGSSTDFQIAINDHLLRGLSVAQRDRVGIFRRTDPVVIHPKTTLIDDFWAMVGSANMMRRSLYTDLEHSVAFMDENNHAETIGYRRNLWGTHLGSSPANLQTAIDAWFNIAVGSSLGKVKRVRLPLPAASRSSQEQILYDEIADPDSRQAWGGIALIRLLLSAAGGSGSGS
ncbi:MAG: phosphatidylserine/phosphatidylglycerophosphate/cardiolipin synthase family protein [Synechococcus sp.]